MEKTVIRVSPTSQVVSIREETPEETMAREALENREPPGPPLITRVEALETIQNLLLEALS